MDSTRQQKMARLLQKEMGDIFEIDMRRLFPGSMITITKVNVTKDLSIARFYVSIFALKDKKPPLEDLRKHIPEFRYKLGNQIRRQVRIIPQLEFFEDDSLDYIENLEKLI
ncbi:MAG: 30S ribosome-binding factor RbfA [Bacteroidales bacterium]|nr:30S ribosome-binding factor RbfA [Bacteroidales bacterium]